MTAIFIDIQKDMMGRVNALYSLAVKDSSPG
jgi:hypothetical protein